MIDIKHIFGDNIRKYRSLQRLTQEQLAIDSNVERSYITEIENGKRNITIEGVERIASALKIPSAFLFEHSTDDIQQFKENFFDLPSRPFGESYAEPILRSFLGDTKKHGAGTGSFDANRHNDRVEYKAVRVIFDTKKSMNFYTSILESSKPMSKRIAKISDIANGDVIANCQNIKFIEFDILVYTLVDDDGFHIFEISSKRFQELADTNGFPAWSPNHGKAEHGKNGQFPITKDNIKWHIANTFKMSKSWEEVLNAVKAIAG